MTHMLLAWVARGAIYDVIYKVLRHAGLPVTIGFTVIAVGAWTLTRRRHRHQSRR